jgi:hypothetical protein
MVQVRLKHFEIAGHRAYYRPAGVVSLNQVVSGVNDAIALARRQGVRKLLADLRKLRGFDPPSLAERYWFISKWAFTGSGAVRVGVVARQEMIDPHKFGVTVAANCGMASDVFALASEATAWLDGHTR